MDTPSTPAVIFILGPTASGKSALALALAQRFAVEIISMDSAQIYRGMDIGTAKPSTHIQADIPHHLIDILDPDHAYSAAQFRQDVLQQIPAIHARKKIPLLVGGTMLYYHTLLHGLHDLPAADPATREQIDARAKKYGWPSVHQELQQLDPITAQRLAPNDAQRIQRALEVCLSTGIAFSKWLTLSDKSAFPYASIRMALFPQNRKELHSRIAQRFHQMIEAGLIEEVVALRKRFHLRSDLPSMRCVGYRQVWDYLEGQIDKAAMIEKSIIATRQLAKRQLTWLRGFENLIVVDPLELSLTQMVEKLSLAHLQYALPSAV